MVLDLMMKECDVLLFQYIRALVHPFNLPSFQPSMHTACISAGGGGEGKNRVWEPKIVICMDR